MSSIQLPTQHSQAHEHAAPHVAARARLNPAEVTPGPGFGAMARNGLLFAGAVGLLVTIAGAFLGGADEGARALAGRHALTAYHTGFLYVLGVALGSLGAVMIFQQFNAGWSAAVRRTCETVASLFPVVALLFLPVLLLELGVNKGEGHLFPWLNEHHTAGDPVYESKSGFLNPTFFTIRAAIYFTVWIGLGTSLYRLSRRQDADGDRWHTARMRWISSFGLLAFALTTAFASFDWLMSLDYHFFSTMFGVYFFAGSMLTTLAVCCVLMCSAKLAGKYGPTFTVEHQHDLGKLLFAFTVFWAYVTFAQYFLIWYSNIPEETAFYNVRDDGAYRTLFVVLCLGHFLLPFLVLLIRKVKRTPSLLRVVALWMLVMHAADLVYMVRPSLHGRALGEQWWVDAAGIVGPVCLFLGLVVWKMGRAPLVPIKDPRLDEVLEHKNYV